MLQITVRAPGHFELRLSGISVFCWTRLLAFAAISLDLFPHANNAAIAAIKIIFFIFVFV